MGYIAYICKQMYAKILADLTQWIKEEMEVREMLRGGIGGWMNGKVNFQVKILNRKFNIIDLNDTEG